MMIIVCLLLVPLSGCWGIKEIQNQVYITALGIDFQKGKYIIYFQSLSFSSIAKQEGNALLPEAPPVLLGKGTGETIDEAFDDIQKSSFIPMYFGQISSLYFTPSFLENHLDEFLDYAGRTELIRYNTWVYSVKQNLQQSMIVNGFFNKSPIYTLVFNPEEVFRNNSFIPFITYQNLIQRYREPVSSILIPTLQIDSTTWKEGNGTKKIVKIDGGYFLSDKKLTGWVKGNDLKGLAWLTHGVKKLYLSSGTKKVAVQIVRPRSQIDVIKGEFPKYRITLDVPVTIEENYRNVPVEEIKRILAKQVKGEVNNTFKKGLEMNTDPYHLAEKAYRFSMGNWDMNELNQLSPDSLEKIKVNIIIEHTRNYKK
ncbi:Ger(x)C family spore germination protein [Bacillus sp. mrc49]|uniref:Ger(x)C family spore germination protein n=1 Tax=Bacillus sp. mrc49 TaxID=2054913 RepID=UPI001E5686CD|nr:Ger(x)C family spore germination protein [Bacillus sp. mrc49]